MSETSTIPGLDELGEYLKFSDEQEDFKLIQVENSFADRIRKRIENKGNDKFYIEIVGGKGRVGSVLSTEDETLDLLRVQYSSTVLLKQRKVGVINGSVNCFYETNKKPFGIIKLEVFETLKNHSEYYSLYSRREEIEDYNENTIKIRKQKKKLTIKDLRSTILGSKNEIKKSLEALNCMNSPVSNQKDSNPESSQYWQLVTDDDDLWIREMIMHFVGSRIGWKITEIDEEKTTNFLVKNNEFSQNEVVFGLKRLSISNSRTRQVNGKTLWTFDKDKIAIFHAEILFKDCSIWETDEFMYQWKRNTNNVISSFEGLEDYSPDISLLFGMFYFEDHREKKMIKLNARDLPITPKKRIDHLFSIKKKWLTKEIEPYASDFIENKKMTEKFLSHFARAIKTMSGKRFYIPL